MLKLTPALALFICCGYSNAAEYIVKPAFKNQTIDGKIKHRFKSGALLVETDAKFNKSDFEYVEPNFTYHAFKKPNDPKYNSLYGMKKIEAEINWKKHVGARNIVIGVIDTGINYNHPDLQNNIWVNPGEFGIDGENGEDKRFNGIDDDGNGYVDDWRGWDFVNNDNDPMDDQGHGTHVAGTIAASGNNGVGVVGVMWRASLVGLKFLDKNGSGSLADAMKAIEYAIDNNIKITNNSWGGGSFSVAMEDLLKRVGEEGGLFIAAAGNHGANNDDRPTYPASYYADSVIAVAATDRNDSLAYFSCYGRESVDVAAPGVSILSTYEDYYSYLSGTSMAAPHVAGVAGLIWSFKPDYTNFEVKNHLLESAKMTDKLEGKVKYGALKATLPYYDF